MTNTITFSSELMKNYKQAELMSPEEKFEALLTDNNHALLFSIGTDQTFYVTQEMSEHDTGWEKTDLSSDLITKDFASQEGVFCKTFEVAQNAQNGSIGMAMVISDSSQDYLYLCLGNSNTDLSWLDNPAWISFPYDDVDHPLSSVLIVNVCISETASDDQYIVVDTLRDPESPEALVYRHYIDTDKPDGYAWHPQDVPFDLEANSNYGSCLGRQKGQYIDGMYTFGQVDGDAQFIYQPLYNVWNPDIPASPARLHLPGNLIPDAMASVRKDDLSTDLFASANSSLYYFASSKQNDGAEGVLLYTHEMFNRVSKLFAFSSDENIIVWGLNADDEIFYTACPLNQLGTSSAWSYPLPILTQVDMVSPYVNKANNGNAFFAVADDELKIVTQSPHTTSWKSQSITLPALDTDPAQKFSSYTTRIQINDENDQPVADTAFSLSASTRTAVYINHLYYILDTTPIQINTDQLGSLTIVEWVDSLNCAQLIISGADGQSVFINPMEQPFNKVAALDTADSLTEATITSYDGSTKPLVDSETSNSDLEAVASGNQQLADCYASLTTCVQLTTFTKRSVYSHSTNLKYMSYTSAAASSDIVVVAGDLYNWLKSGVESVIEIVEDAANGVWHFVATIAGQVYRAVLDTVETVLGAIEWVFNVIKTAIEDLIAFLEFLFEWADITRTKKVIKNLAMLFLEDQVEGIEEVKEEFNGMINDAVTAINSWAGIADWTGLGSSANDPVNADSSPSSGSSSSSTFLSHHFQNNAGSISLTSSTTDPDPTQSLIDTLLDTINQEGDILGEVITQLYDLAAEYPNLSLSDILEKLIAILVDGVLESAANVVDAILDLLYQLGTTILEILSAKIHIPVISDILNDFGVPDISMIDLFCWITAVPTTLIYKLANNKAPFPDDSNTSFLINATDFDEVKAAFASEPDTLVYSGSKQRKLGNWKKRRKPSRKMIDTSVAMASTTTMPSSVDQSMFTIGHTASGFFTLMATFVTSFEAAEETGENPWSTPSTILGVFSGACSAIASILVPKAPIKDTAISWLSNITQSLTVLNLMIFSGPAQGAFGSSTSILSSFKVNDSRATGSVIDAILAIPALICTVYHFVELSGDPVSDERSQAIVEETSSICSYISRNGYTFAVNTDDPEVKIIPIGIMVGGFVCYSGLQLGDALIK